MLGRNISLSIDSETGSNHDENLTCCPNLYIEWMRDTLQRAFDIVHEFYVIKLYQDNFIVI